MVQTPRDHGGNLVLGSNESVFLIPAEQKIAKKVGYFRVFCVLGSV